jgi:hypothetical protein
MQLVTAEHFIDVVTKNFLISALLSHYYTSYTYILLYSLCKTLRYVSAPRQLQRVCGNAHRGASWRLYWETYRGYTQRTYTRVQLSNNIRINGGGAQTATWKWSILFPDTRPGIPFGLTATVQTKQISQVMNNFIFSILLKWQQNGLKTNETNGIWDLKVCDYGKLLHLLRFWTLSSILFFIYRPK